MARKTIYCAQAFWLRDGRLAGGEVHQFLNEERARLGAQALFTGCDGVAVFSLKGHPDEDVWADPQLLSTLGMTPALTTDGNCDWVDDAA